MLCTCTKVGREISGGDLHFSWVATLARLPPWSTGLDEPHGPDSCSNTLAKVFPFLMPKTLGLAVRLPMKASRFLNWEVPGAERPLQDFLLVDAGSIYPYYSTTS